MYYTAIKIIEPFLISCNVEMVKKVMMSMFKKIIENLSIDLTNLHENIDFQNQRNKSNDKLNNVNTTINKITNIK